MVEKRITRRSLVQILAALGWILLVSGGYYYYHKPLDIANLPAPLGAVLDLFCAFLILLVIGGTGRRLLPAPALHPLERFAAQTAAGFGAWSLVWLLFGGLGLYKPWAGLTLLALGILLNWKLPLAWLRESAALADAWRLAKTIEKCLAAISALLCGNQLLLALSPPAGWDALSYHLQLPRLYLGQGSIGLIAENPYWGHPQAGEMLYTWASSMFRAETAAVMGWMLGMVLLIGVMGIALRHTYRMPSRSGEAPAQGIPAAWMAVAALLCGATFRGLLGLAYTDLAAALAGLSALICLLYWLEDHDLRMTAWFGIFAGLAASVKLTAGILLPAGLLFIALEGRKNPGVRKQIAVAAGMAALVLIPWLFKDWIVTGNPLYPYFFASPWVSAMRLSAASQAPLDPAWLEQLFLPFSLTWRGIQNAEPFFADISPLLLLFGVPGLWVQRKQQAARLVALFILFGWAALSLGGAYAGHLRQARLYFALLSGLALAAGWGWAHLQQLNPGGVRLRRLFGALALLVIGLAAWQDITASARLNPLALLTGSQTREQYEDNTLGWYAPAMRALYTLPQGSKTLMLWEPRGLYAPLGAVPDPWIDRYRVDRWALGSHENILADWKTRGFTHLLLYKTGAEMVRQEPGLLNVTDWQALDDLLRRLPEPRSFGDVYLLYTLSR